VREPDQIASVHVLRPPLSEKYERFRQRGREQVLAAGIGPGLIMMTSAAREEGALRSPSIAVRGWFDGCLDGLLELARAMSER